MHKQYQSHMEVCFVRRHFKKLIALTGLALVITLSPVKASASWEPWQPSDVFGSWQDAYMALLTRYMWSFSNFWLLDIDQNGIPELLLGNNPAYSPVVVYTFRDGRVIRTGQTSPRSSRDWAEWQLYTPRTPHNRVGFIIHAQDGAVTRSSYYVLEGNSLVRRSTGEYFYTSGSQLWTYVNNIMVSETVHFNEFAGSYWPLTRSTSQTGSAQTVFNNWTSPHGISAPPINLPPHPFFGRDFAAWHYAYEEVIRAMLGSGYVRFSLHDINFSGIPELFVSYGAYEETRQWQVFTFENSQVQQIGVLNDGWQSMGLRVPSNYRTGVIESSHADAGSGFFSLYNIIDGMLAQTARGEHWPDFDHPDFDWETNFILGHSLTVDGVSRIVDEEEFNSVFGGGSFPSSSVHANYLRSHLMGWRVRAHMAHPRAAYVHAAEILPICMVIVDGSSFVRLRDFAIALRDTEQRFDIVYDSATSTVSLVSGRNIDAYELVLPRTEPIVARPSISPVLLDGVSLGIATHRVDGAIYMAIGRLSEALGLELEVDGDTFIVIADVSEVEVEIADEASAEPSRPDRLSRVERDDPVTLTHTVVEPNNDSTVIIIAVAASVVALAIIVAVVIIVLRKKPVPAIPPAPSNPLVQSVDTVCKNCGASLSTSTKFCTKCGTRAAYPSSD